VRHGRLTRPPADRAADVAVRAEAAALVRVAREARRLRAAERDGLIEVTAGRRHLAAVDRAFALTA
jgi:hypothetical protein